MAYDAFSTATARLNGRREGERKRDRERQERGETARGLGGDRRNSRGKRRKSDESMSLLSALPVDVPAR
ncbi:hypothetical protein JOB18_003540 [Solea senegalensis]|uniref:Uncharacterized protein n=1 Tax=Solea senegalensis TaxID=28829 RepID=A0AAV6RRL2_SOLSE|nr:hypothetical protein JOB18_003540 [Solea senegalensis]